MSIDVNNENKCSCQVDQDCCEELKEERDDATVYFEGGTIRKALPGRTIALLITLGIEIPVAVLVSQSSSLCDLIGPQRLTLVLSFLPVTSAIAGNVGLQSSSL